MGWIKEFRSSGKKKAGEGPRSPAADDLDGKLALALLVSALPAHGEAAFAQRRPAEAQLVVLEELGLLKKKRKRVSWM